MLAHTALGRRAAAKTSTRDLAQLARFVHRTIWARNASDLPAARALSRAYTSALQSRRSYATTTAATKPTATVKKAVKAQASKAAPKKKAAASTKTAKKPARKAAATKAKPKTRATAKTKAKPKAKKAAPKKPAARKRVKKVLTDEQKLKAKAAELRKVALREPVTPNKVSARNVYVAENTKGSADGGSATSKLTAASQRFSALTPAELEHYNHIANEQTAAKRAEYKAWIESHTPSQINLANNARAQLRAKFNTKKTGYPVHTQRLVDERQPKRPASGYARFVAGRFATGDLKGIAVADAGKIIAGEWKSLSAGEKKRYEDLGAAGRSEYVREMTERGMKTSLSTKA